MAQSFYHTNIPEGVSILIFVILLAGHIIILAMWIWQYNKIKIINYFDNYDGSNYFLSKLRDYALDYIKKE